MVSSTSSLDCTHVWESLSPWIHHVDAKLWPHHLHVSAESQTHRSRLHSLPLQPHISVFGWQRQFSAVVACSPEASTCCTFWDTLLFTTLVKSGYRSHCTSFCQLQPVWLFSSGLPTRHLQHWCLLDGFLLLLLFVGLLFTAHWVNSCCCVKIPGDHQFQKNTQTSRSDPNNHAKAESDWDDMFFTPILISCISLLPHDAGAGRL